MRRRHGVGRVMRLLDTEGLRHFGRACAMAGAAAALLALWMAAATPNGAIRECLAIGQRQCDLGWHKLWREFLAPLVGLTLLGVAVVCFARAALVARVALGGLTAIAAFVILFALYAALQHNPQEEFCVYVKNEPGDWLAWMLGQEPCRIVWSECLRLACAGFIIALPPILLLHGLIVLAATRLWPPKPRHPRQAYKQFQRWPGT